MRRNRPLLPIVWLMALLVLPVTAYVAGVRQPELENRTKAPFPDLNRGTLRQEHTFQQIDAAIRERLPLRRHAIDLRGRIAIDVFGDSPTEDVVLGKDRWLYYAPETRVCAPETRPPAPPADAVELLTRAIAASGRTPVVTIAGSKIVTHREHLKGFSAEALACVAGVEAAVHERLDTIDGGYTFQDEQERMEAGGRATFLRSDTHWNALGREIFARTVLDAVRPGLADEARLRRLGETERRGDLGDLIGQKRIDRDPMLTVTGNPKTAFAPGDVLFVGDSQLEAALRTPGADGATVLERVFPGQPVCNWADMYANGCVEPMLAARTVVIEAVGRNLGELTANCWRPVANLTAAIHGRPARWAGTDDSSRAPATPSPTTMRVEVDDDRTGVPRLLRIPVRNLAADPAADPASPPTISAVPPGDRACALPAISSLEFPILIPIAADERVSDVELRISGPAGSELGRPEVVVLDGTPPAQR